MKMTYDQLLSYLEHEAVNHIAYYHYTCWECLRKMLLPVLCDDGKKHRLLFLSRADKTNDGLEEHWSRNYYMACFSLSRYEDVAMWLNYGKRGRDAIRIKITRDKMDEWLGSPHAAFKVKNVDEKGVDLLNDISTRIAETKLYGLAYVIPSKHWVRKEDGILASKDSNDFVDQSGNIEFSRGFHTVSKDGDCKWVDKIYDGADLSDSGIPPIFKKRGWAYEREIRLVVKLKDGTDAGERIGIAFDGPLEEIERCMRMSESERGAALWGDKMTPKIKLWDKRFPVIQSGPWYEEGYRPEPICGFELNDAFKSDYQREIKMFG